MILFPFSSISCHHLFFSPLQFAPILFAIFSQSLSCLYFSRSFDLFFEGLLYLIPSFFFFYPLIENTLRISSEIYWRKPRRIHWMMKNWLNTRTLFFKYLTPTRMESYNWVKWLSASSCLSLSLSHDTDTAPFRYKIYGRKCADNSKSHYSMYNHLHCSFSPLFQFIHQFLRSSFSDFSQFFQKFLTSSVLDPQLWLIKIFENIFILILFPLNRLSLTIIPSHHLLYFNEFFFIFVFFFFRCLLLLSLFLSFFFLSCRLLPVKENFLNRSTFRGASKLSKDDIERVFALYDRVCIQHIRPTLSFYLYLSIHSLYLLFPIENYIWKSQKMHSTSICYYSNECN